MAIARAAGQTVASGGSISATVVMVTLAQNIVAGNTVVVAAQMNNGATSFTFADNLSPNSLQQDVFKHDTVGIESVAIGSCLNVITAGACTITVTANGSGGADRMGVVAEEYSGLGGAAVDKTATNTGSTTAYDSGTTATTTAADELLFAVEGDSNNLIPVTYAGSFSKLAENATGRCGAADRIVAATGTYNATGTGSNPVAWAGAIATYKAAAVATVADGRDLSIPVRPTGPARRRAFQQVYADTPITPTELTQTPAAPFAAIGPRRRRSMPQQYADTTATAVELTQSPAAPFRPGRGPGMGPMLLRRNIVWPSATSSPDVTLSLTGVQGTASLGTLGVNLDIALTGNAATGSVGTLAPDSSVAMTGLSATGSVGTLAPDTAVPITGVVGTGSVGTLAPTNTITLTGNEATVSIGTLSPNVAGDVTIALTGVIASVLIGNLSPSGADVPTSPATGGDDVPRRRKSPHKGFDLEAWKARQQDFEGTIRQAYDDLMRGPHAEEVRDIVAPHLETDPDVQRDIDWQALFADYRAISDMIQIHEAQMMEEEAIVSLLIH